MTHIRFLLALSCLSCNNNCGGKSIEKNNENALFICSVDSRVQRGNLCKLHHFESVVRRKENASKIVVEFRGTKERSSYEETMDFNAFDHFTAQFWAETSYRGPSI